MYCLKCGKQLLEGSSFCAGCGVMSGQGQLDNQPMTKRGIGVIIALSIVTFGIYYLVWYCSMQNQLRHRTGLGFFGVGHFFATIFTLGIYAIVWHFNVSSRVARVGGRNRGNTYGLVYLGFYFVAMILMWIGMPTEFYDPDVMATMTASEMLALYGLSFWIGTVVSSVGMLVVMAMIQRDINDIGMDTSDIVADSKPSRDYSEHVG